MGHLRFWQRVRVAPGVTVSLAKRGVSSVSVGVRGAHYTVGRDGERRMTVGAPGTGLFYTQQKRSSRRQHGPARPGRLLPLWLLLLISMLLFIWLGTIQDCSLCGGRGALSDGRIHHLGYIPALSAGDTARGPAQ